MVKEQDHRFLFFLCKTFQKLPTDPFFEQIDPLEKMWLFYSWAHDNNVNIENMKDQAILIGSFSNLEMAKQMSKGPDYQLSEDDYESSWQYVQSQPMKDSSALDGINTRRRRRVVS